MRTRVCAMAAVALLAMACGGSPAEGDRMTDSPTPSGEGGTGENPGADRGNPTAPITVTVDGTPYGYELGRCEIIDDVVYAAARGGSHSGNLALALPGWDVERPYAHRDGQVTVYHNDHSTLEANRESNGTTWEWTVNGNEIEVNASLGNRDTAEYVEGRWHFGDWHDVTIRIDCPQGTFGSPTAAGAAGVHAALTPVSPRVQPVPGSVTVELGGTTYEIDFLLECALTPDSWPSVEVDGASNEASARLTGSLGTVVMIGDQRSFANVPARYSFGDDEMPWEHAGSTATWSGAAFTEAGDEVPASISVSCE